MSKEVVSKEELLALALEETVSYKVINVREPNLIKYTCPA